MKLTIYILFFSGLAFSASTLLPKDDSVFLEKRAELVVREIGHHLLLISGDSASRILPVKKYGEHTFRLEFQNKFSFMPDTLVAVVHRRLKAAGLPLDYRVSVLNCGVSQLVFGYEMNTRKGDVLPCIGRSQSEDCYVIDIEFIENEVSVVNGKSVLLITLFSVVMLVMFYARKRFKKPVPTETEPFLMIGAYTFYFEKKLLKNKNETVELSDKEAKILHIFARHQNETVERDRLLKEVWEDEGIFVIGRSLDVFVSKLRKKLQNDPRVKITNIHGKGYKLWVE